MRRSWWKFLPRRWCRETFCRFDCTPGVRSAGSSVPLSNNRCGSTPLGTGGRWEALAGVDLESKPGLHSLTGTVWMSDGRSKPIQKSLRVLPKKFPVQRIRVRQKYVTLNPRDSERAAREHLQLTEVWQSATARRMWAEPFIRPVSSKRAAVSADAESSTGNLATRTREST